jgi:hypothetical protein
MMLILASDDNSEDHYAKGTPSQLINSRSDRLYANGFRNCFTPLHGVLFTFPSLYWFTIGLSGVFILTGWARQIHAELHVIRATQDTAKIKDKLKIQGYHLLWQGLPTHFLSYVKNL